MDYKVVSVKPRDGSKKNWRQVVEKEYWTRQINMDAVARSK